MSARARLRGASRVDLAVEEILERYHMRRYLKVKRTVRQEHTFKQASRGRPGANTAYRRITRRLCDLVDRRYGEKSVYRLDTTTFEIVRVQTTGESPGWIHKHRAARSGPAEIYFAKR